MILFQTATSIIVDQIIKFYDNDGSKVKKKKRVQETSVADCYLYNRFVSICSRSKEIND